MDVTNWTRAEVIATVVSTVAFCVSACAFIATAIFAWKAYRETKKSADAAQKQLELARADRQEAKERHRMAMHDIPRDEWTDEMKALLVGILDPTTLSTGWRISFVRGVFCFGTHIREREGSSSEPYLPISSHGEAMLKLVTYGLMINDDRGWYLSGAGSVVREQFRSAETLGSARDAEGRKDAN